MQPQHIEFTEIPFEQIAKIEGLWKKNRELHEHKSANFTDFFHHMTFEKRKKTLFKDDGTRFRILLAADRESGTDVGYCVSTITADGTGEVDSLFVEKAWRGHRIGRHLMEDALRWFHECDTKSVWVSVIHGNEDALGFYAAFGLFPKTHELTFATDFIPGGSRDRTGSL